MLLTPQLKHFFPNFRNLNIFSLKPQTLCVWEGANSATWPSTYIYIYIYHLINIELLFFFLNMFIIIKENPNGYCKVEFYQPSCWLYSVPNLLVF